MTGQVIDNLLSVEQLHSIPAVELLLVDCRFNLMQPEAGSQLFLESHLPAAVYAHLDDDLAAPVTPQSGRHPLPESSSFARFLSECGWRPGQLVVAYDDAGGAIAARLWWLMKYFGIQEVALLDGGYQAWVQAGFELESGQAKSQKTPLPILQPQTDLVVSTAQVLADLKLQNLNVVDARAKARFAGEVEPIDTKAGHIPGSLNHPFDHNLDQAGRFKSGADIRKAFQASLGEAQPASMVHMCGSGVTACHNLFAAELAGFKGSRLYVGSWSEWITDDSRPVAVD